MARWAKAKQNIRLFKIATTPIYLVLQCSFGVSTCAGWGRITARRVS